MNPTEKPSPLTADDPGLESTETDSPAGASPTVGPSDETGDFAAGATTGHATGDGIGDDPNATADVAPSPGRPPLDATIAPSGPADTTAHATAAPDADATADLDNGATADHDPNATADFDRDATDDHDPDATDGFVISPGAGLADTEKIARPAGGRKDVSWPRISGYEILEVLGVGGMGIVYKARQARLDRLVALKMIRAGTGARPGDLLRFEAEARAVAAIDHPNIIKIFEIGEHDGLPYFSLEFLAGGSLLQRIDGKPQPVDEAAKIVETMAHAMAVAHASGIVHRDIKPANVLLAPDGTPKIADFGLVKRLEADSGQTREGSILGSPSYMAPEQTTGAEKAGPAADQYALGATLYEMLTGRPPFRGTSILDTLDLVRTKEPVPPSELLPRMPRDLETICLKCLQKDPARRYPDVGALAEDLRRFRAGEPIVARPISGVERAWRWCRRNKASAALIAAVALLMVLVTAGSAAFAAVLSGKNRALTAARNTAEEAKTRAVNAGQAAIKQNQQVVDDQRKMILLLEDKFRTTPGLQAMRKEVLDLATHILETAANSMTALRSEVGWPEGDEELNWRSVALAHQRIGEVRVTDNNLAEAEKEFRLCNEIIARLAAADPENLENQNRLLKSCRQLAYFALHKMGDAQEALRIYQRALEIARDCVAKDPDSDKYKADLAATLGVIEIAEFRLGHLERARELLDEARAVRESRSAAESETPGARRELAFLYDQLFDLSLRLDDRPAARRYNERCAELDRSILATDPENWPVLYNLARSYNNSGMLLYPMGRDPAAARPFHRKALALIEKWVKADPTNADALQRLSTTQYYEATCALHSGDRDGAAALYRRCLEIREKLARDTKAKMPLIELMVAAARCGQHARAAAIAQDLVARPPDNEMMDFQAACGFALSAGAVRDQQTPEAQAVGGALLAAAHEALYRSYADRAIDCLRRGKARGFADVVSLETDPDLEPIRDEPAFRSLIAEFPRPSAPKS